MPRNKCFNRNIRPVVFNRILYGESNIIVNDTLYTNIRIYPRDRWNFVYILFEFRTHDDDDDDYFN